MYAIIRAGGHQEKVAPGEQITVDRLKKEVGETVEFTPLLISKGDGTVVSDRKELGEVGKVLGTVVQHVKGDKIDVFMYRNKTGYRRHTGHRQPLTLVEISEIRLGEEIARAPEQKAASAAQAGGEASSEPATKPAAKKPAAKKAPAKKAPAKKATT